MSQEVPGTKVVSGGALVTTFSPHPVSSQVAGIRILLVVVVVGAAGIGACPVILTGLKWVFFFFFLS